MSSIVEQDREEAESARRMEDRYGPAGGPRDPGAQAIYNAHPWRVCLCDGCKARREEWAYPGPCAGCGSELRRSGGIIHLRDGQDRIVCRAGGMHRPADTPRSPGLTGSGS